MHESWYNLLRKHLLRTIVGESESSTGSSAQDKQDEQAVESTAQQDTSTQAGSSASASHGESDSTEKKTASEDEPLGGKGMKALRDERESNRALKAENSRLKEQLAHKSDDSSTVEQRLKALEDERDLAKRENMQIKVAAAKGLPVDLASRLQGSTLEELEADADKLVSLFSTRAESQPRMKPDNSQGKSGVPAPSTLAEAIQEHYSK